MEQARERTGVGDHAQRSAAEMRSVASEGAADLVAHLEVGAGPPPEVRLSTAQTVVA
jgi:hypothetical protein